MNVKKYQRVIFVKDWMPTGAVDEKLRPTPLLPEHLMKAPMNGIAYCEGDVGTTFVIFGKAHHDIAVPDDHLVVDEREWIKVPSCPCPPSDTIFYRCGTCGEPFEDVPVEEPC